VSPVVEKSDRKEPERRLEQAKRAVALFNDPVTTERLLSWSEIWKSSSLSSRVGGDSETNRCIALHTICPWHSSGLENAQFAAHIMRIMRDQWTEKLVCPNCRKTGVAELSQTDDLSWDVRADSVSEGFNVMQVEHGIEFHCASCGVHVEP
jgi:predicted RNA-binding Zn-ribbon protein involved in translation (DUF1610 family)